MTDTDFKKALAYVSLGDKSQLAAFLSSINSDIRQFANVAFNSNKVDKYGWEKLTGEPMPDLAKENAFHDFKSRLENGSFTIEELQTSYADERYDQAIRNYINNRVQNRNLDQEDLKEYYKRGLLNENEVKDYCRSSGFSFDEIDQKPYDFINIPPHLWPLEPSLTYGNTDVLLVGSPGAGKTMLLASLFHYANRTVGTLNPDARNSSGYAYSSILISAIEQGQFILGTPPNKILHTPATITGTQITKSFFGKTREEKIECPFNFIEMAGETFTDAFGKTIDEWPNNLRTCFEHSKNPKIVILTIPVIEQFIEIGEGASLMKLSSEQLYSYIIDFFVSNGIMDQIVAVGLVITKWDEHSDQSDDGFHNLIEQKCRQLDRTLTNIQNVEYEQFAFSVGSVETERNCYKFSNSKVSEIYEWLMECAPIRPQ